MLMVERSVIFFILHRLRAGHTNDRRARRLPRKLETPRKSPLSL